jgi:reactive intermediate/imine deaminase
MSDKTAVSTTDAPAPMPVFSQGVRKGNILQVSGQGSVDPATGDFVFEGDVKAQTMRTLQNIEAVLAAGGATFDDVVMLRVYLTQRDDFAAMNEAYAEFVGARTTVLPSRTTVFPGLPLPQMLVEIDALAVLG